MLTKSIQPIAYAPAYFFVRMVMNDYMKSKLIFLVIFPVIIFGLGLATSFNYIFITLGCIFCLLGILISPIIIKYFHIKGNDIVTKKAWAIYYVICTGGFLCFIYLGINSDIEKGNLTIFSYMLQYLLAGSITQAIYAFYIQ